MTSTYPAPPVATQQAGVFTARQAVEAGCSAGQVRYRRRHGHWRAVAGAGLTAAPAEPSPRAVAWAAFLTWPEAVVAYRVAAACHGFPVPPGHTVEVIAPARSRPHGSLVPHRVPLPEEDVAQLATGWDVADPTWSGPRVTGRVRTAVDCLTVLPEAEAAALLTWLTTRERLTRQEFTAELQARNGRPGTGQLRRLHRTTHGGALSAAELRLHRLLRRAELTGWTANAQVHDTAGTLIGRADVLFARERVIIEVDGWETHSDSLAFQRDRQRWNRMREAGYHVVHVTWADLTHDPDGVITTIRHALAAAR